MRITREKDGLGQSRHHQGCNYIFVDGHAKTMNLNPEYEPQIPCPGAAIGNRPGFLKMMQVVSYSQTAFEEVARKVEVFADAEDLPAHGAAIARRFFPSTRAQ